MSASEILDNLRSRGKFLVVAESLTGGLLTAEFAKIPGASNVLLTGIIAYDTSLKHELLGVSAQLLENQGPVDPEVAAQMAEGIRTKIAQKRNLAVGSIIGIATTGIAGPTAAAGKKIGEVYIAISQGEEGSTRTNVYAHELAGDREQIQQAVVSLGVGHLWEEIGG